MQHEAAMGKSGITRMEYRTLKKAKMRRARTLKLQKEVGGVVLAAAILTTAASVSAQSKTEYTVKKNDTLYKISQQFGVSVNDLKAMNGKQNDLLLIGETLLIKQVDEKPAYSERVVEAGDSWYKYAKELNVPIADLKKLNNKETDFLLVGEKVLLPVADSGKTSGPIVSKPSPAEDKIISGEKEKVAVKVVVQKGDTLWKIAREYRTTVDQLRAANQLKNNKIKVGQTIVIQDISQSPAIINGAADSNFCEFKLADGKSIVLRVTPFHTIDELANREGLQAIIQYNEVNNELISYSIVK